MYRGLIQSLAFIIIITALTVGSFIAPLPFTGGCNPAQIGYH